MYTGHEPVTGVVEQHGTFATHGLRDQRLLTDGSGPQIHHRRVELTNSMSATAAPARIPSPMPSPVATVGFVDAMKTCPIPPVANTTVGARIAPTPPICPPHDVQCHTLGAP